MCDSHSSGSWVCKMEIAIPPATKRAIEVTVLLYEDLYFFVSLIILNRPQNCLSLPGLECRGPSVNLREVGLYPSSR